MTKTALIIGVSGQDGAYLAQFLLTKGYTVWGSSRDAEGARFGNLDRLGIKDRINLISISPEDFRSVLVGLDQSSAQEVYFLAGQTSVGLSFQTPAETMLSNSQGMLNLLEAIRFQNRSLRVFHAGSSETFGDVGAEPAAETTLPHPRSPYAVSKSAATMLTANYREAYGLFACSGILFNHESPLRPQRFVTQKIIQGAHAIAKGRQDRLTLGRLDIARDWGWAPEYVEAMWLMLQCDTPQDFIIATGETNSLQSFVELAFAAHDLDWRDYVETSDSFSRPSDIAHSAANPSAIKAALGWQATSKMPDVVRKMTAACT
ncbi:GDP-mannose 4,6-dehydratase [Amylibacter marinus]|uniref:GDP-mannose 4,6-dehydratase n=1 Tax=Amylibacter marinus TaxID=1475483 RepID=A0ABQ5VVR3_9RHOB|nr:GDP-mannose 4,6-dehydratase [Amylibacter marinus]GLQ35188.1 GDP-mannose 4,6-dehydratase [Amylibacter marinus]